MARETCEYCNLKANEFLRAGDLAPARTLLIKAEALSTANDQLRADVFNNMACYFRHQKKFRVAFEYLQKAMHIENILPKVPWSRIV